MLLEGAPILVHTVRKFVASPLVHDIVVAVREDDIDWVADMLHLEGRGLLGDLRVVAGGNTRQESVENALAALDGGTDLVAVHDAVRPFIDLDTIRRVVEEAQVTGAAIVGIVPVDTVKQVSGAQAGGAKVRSTISRERLILAQTPQVFRWTFCGGRSRRRGRIISRARTNRAWWSGWIRWRSALCWAATGISRSRGPSDMDLARLFFEQETARR